MMKKLVTLFVFTVCVAGLISCEPESLPVDKVSETETIKIDKFSGDGDEQIVPEEKDG